MTHHINSKRLHIHAAPLLIFSAVTIVAMVLYVGAIQTSVGPAMIRSAVRLQPGGSASASIVVSNDDSAKPASSHTANGPIIVSQSPMATTMLAAKGAGLWLAVELAIRQ